MSDTPNPYKRFICRFSKTTTLAVQDQETGYFAITNCGHPTLEVVVDAPSREEAMELLNGVSFVSRSETPVYIRDAWYPTEGEHTEKGVHLVELYTSPVPEEIGWLSHPEELLEDPVYEDIDDDCEDEWPDGPPDGADENEFPAERFDGE